MREILKDIVDDFKKREGIEAKINEKIKKEAERQLEGVEKEIGVTFKNRDLFIKSCVIVMEILVGADERVEFKKADDGLKIRYVMGQVKLFCEKKEDDTILFGAKNMVHEDVGVAVYGEYIGDRITFISVMGFNYAEEGGDFERVIYVEDGDAVGVIN